jgi:hypothetical protein
LKASLAPAPARSTILAKPAVVNGAPRSDVNKMELMVPGHAVAGAGLAVHLLGSDALPASLPDFRFSVL